MAFPPSDRPNPFTGKTVQAPKDKDGKKKTLSLPKGKAPPFVKGKPK